VTNKERPLRDLNHVETSLSLVFQGSKSSDSPLFRSRSFAKSYER